VTRLRLEDYVAQVKSKNAELAKLQNQVDISNARAEEAKALLEGFKQNAADARKAAEVADGMMKWTFVTLAFMFTAGVWQITRLTRDDREKLSQETHDKILPKTEEQVSQLLEQFKADLESNSKAVQERLETSLQMLIERHELQERLGCRALSDLYWMRRQQRTQLGDRAGALIYGLYAADMAYRGKSTFNASYFLEKCMPLFAEVPNVQDGTDSRDELWNEEEIYLCDRLVLWIADEEALTAVKTIRESLNKSPAPSTEADLARIRKYLGPN